MCAVTLAWDVPPFNELLRRELSGILVPCTGDGFDVDAFTRACLEITRPKCILLMQGRDWRLQQRAVNFKECWLTILGRNS